MKHKINKKLVTLCILVVLAIPTSLLTTASALPPTTTLTLKSGSTTLSLTADDLLAMPSYTGVGAVRSGGSISPSTIGNYTGIPLLYLCNLVGGIKDGSLIQLTASDGYFTTLNYAQVHDNSFTQYNITTNTVIAGQKPLIIVAYAVNGTELSDDLGAPLRDIVVSNNGTSSIMAHDGMATFGNIMCKYLSSIEIFNPPTTPVTFKTCDDTGSAKSTYNNGETVYFAATGLAASTTYPIYVVEDVATWTARISLPTPVSGSETSITTDSSGNIAPTSIFNSAAPGKYDIVVDVNSNGTYDEADLLINNVVTTSGMFVLPEYSFGGLVAIAACFAALIAFAALKTGTGISRFSARKLF